MFIILKKVQHGEGFGKNSMVQRNGPVLNKWTKLKYENISFGLQSHETCQP